MVLGRPWLFILPRSFVLHLHRALPVCHADCWTICLHDVIQTSQPLLREGALISQCYFKRWGNAGRPHCNLPKFTPASRVAGIWSQFLPKGLSAWFLSLSLSFFRCCLHLFLRQGLSLPYSLRSRPGCLVSEPQRSAFIYNWLTLYIYKVPLFPDFLTQFLKPYTGFKGWTWVYDFWLSHFPSLFFPKHKFCFIYCCSQSERYSTSWTDGGKQWA